MLLALALNLCTCAPPAAAQSAGPTTIQANHVAEITLVSTKTYANPFTDVTLEAVVTPPDGPPLRVPAFWAGGNRWRFRYASPLSGRHAWRTECSDRDNRQLHAVQGHLDVTAGRETNSLYQHGPIRVAEDRRHFVHADGTPFLWLGDTWWKGLCKRLTWEGFQELTADRRAKGFSVVQIVCGPYPDEGTFEARWENEGGKPYETHDFSRVNPAYFEFADRRLGHLVSAGIVPAIVGGWGRPDCDSMALAGLEGMKRHWRNLIARYGAYPTVWIIGGESGGPLWTEVARFVRQTDPFHRPVTMHPGQSARSAVTDETVLDFDMLQTGHGEWPAALGAIPQLRAAYARTPAMPAMIGEFCYEEHMQSAFADVERYVFWGAMLSGSPGITYGAAGVWHAGVEGDPGLGPVYDLTTWKEGMSYPGSAQLGLGKRLLEQYPWQRFEPHPEWAEPGSFAAGIPGQVRFLYMPKRGVYNWTGPAVSGLERDVLYRGFYFDPARGRRFDAGQVVSAGPPPEALTGGGQPRLFEDRFQGTDASAWRDHGTPTRRERGRLVGGKGMVTLVEGITEADVSATVEANSDAEAGIILRFQNPDHYLVGLYTPLFKCIYLHDRKNGEYGDPLGRVPVPDIGPRIRLTAAACGDHAALLMTDGKQTFCTPVVRVSNVAAGKTGLWLNFVGDRQEYGGFELSRAQFSAPAAAAAAPGASVVWFGSYQAPNAPSPQDWVLVLDRAQP